MAGNVSIETDAADNWKPSKKRSPERIDGIVALVMALDRASRENGRWDCIYNYRGPAVICVLRSCRTTLVEGWHCHNMVHRIMPAKNLEEEEWWL